MQQKYNLELTVTSTSGILAGNFLDAAILGTLTIEADDQALVAGQGNLTVSGNIDTKNGKPISPSISFTNEIVPFSNSKISFTKEINGAIGILSANINTSMNPPVITNIQIEISKRILFINQSATLNGYASATQPYV